MKRLLLFLMLLSAPSYAQYFGDVAPSDVVDWKFTTRTTTGAPTQLAGSPVVKCYKSNATNSEVTTGVTLSVDFDSITGLNNLRVDTSADGSFYAAGTNIACVITTGTVGGTSVVGETVLEFSINNRSALRPATAGRTLVVDAAGLADANAVKVGPTGSGTAQTARDLGATLGAWTGTGVNTILGAFKAVARADASTPSDIGGTFDPATDSLEAIADSGIVLTAQAEENLNSFFDNNSTDSDNTVGQLVTLIKNQAFSNYPIWMLSSTGNGVTGATVTCVMQKDGGAFLASTNPVTEIGRGKYVVSLTATETNGNVLAIECTATGAVTYRTNVTPLH